MMKLIYSKPINAEIRDLQSREHDWRARRCRLVAQGCVPGLKFEMRPWAVKALPDEEEWPGSRRGVDAMIEARVDMRFVMSEIVRRNLDPDLFGYCLQRAPRFGRIMLALLMWHRRSHPDHAHLTPYIDSGRQAWVRFEAHRILAEIDGGK